MQHARHQPRDYEQQQQDRSIHTQEQHDGNQDTFTQERYVSDPHYRLDAPPSQNASNGYHNTAGTSTHSVSYSEDYSTYTSDRRYPPAPPLQRTNSSSSEDEYYSYSSDNSIPSHLPAEYLDNPFDDQAGGRHSLQEGTSTIPSTPFQQHQYYDTTESQITPYQSHHRRDSSAGSAGIGNLGLGGHRGGHASDSSLSSEIDANPLLRQDLHKNGKPKRPLNSFMIFSRFRRPKLQKEQPDMKVAELARELADEWKNLPPEEKKRFQDDAKVVKSHFHKMNPDYVYSRRPNGAKSRKAKRSSTPSSAGSSGSRRARSRADSGDGSAGSGSISAFSPGGYSSSADSSTGSMFFPPMPLPLSHPASRDRTANSSPGPPPGTAASGSTAFGAAGDAGMHSPTPVPSITSMDPSTTNMFASLDLDQSFLPSAPPPTPSAPRNSRHGTTATTFPSVLQPVFGDPVLMQYSRHEDARNISSSGSGSSSGSRVHVSANSFVQSVDNGLQDYRLSQARQRTSTPPPHMYNNAIYGQNAGSSSAHPESSATNAWTPPPIPQPTSQRVSSAPSTMMYPSQSIPQAYEAQSPTLQASVTRSHTIATATRRKPPVAGISRMNRNRNGSQGSLSSDDSGNFYHPSQPISRRGTANSDADPFLLPRPSQHVQQTYYERSDPLSVPAAQVASSSSTSPVKTTLPSLSRMFESPVTRNQRGPAQAVATPKPFFATYPSQPSRSRAALAAPLSTGSEIPRDSAIFYSSSPSSYGSSSSYSYDLSYSSQPRDAQRYPHSSSSMPSLHQNTAASTPLPAFQPIQPQTPYQPRDRYKLPPLDLPSLPARSNNPHSAPVAGGLPPVGLFDESQNSSNYQYRRQ